MGNENLILKGAYSAEFFADAIDAMKVTGLPRGQSIGWDALDEYYTVPKGQWTVITGFSSSGKSTWLDNVFVQLARTVGWKFLICSPENQPIERHIAGLMEIYSGRKFGSYSALLPNIHAGYYMSHDEYNESFKFVAEHFYFINPPDTEFTLEGIIAIAEEVHATSFQFDGMVLDPYNEIEHRRPAGMNETDYVSTVIQHCRAFTHRLNIHFWFVAHPTKPTRMAIKYNKSDLEESDRKPVYQRATLFDISGSAHWKSKCDFGLIVHRDMANLQAPSLIEIEKVRFRESGKPGEVPMYYDYLCGRYVERASALLFGSI